MQNNMGLYKGSPIGVNVILNSFQDLDHLHEIPKQVRDDTVPSTDDLSYIRNGNELNKRSLINSFKI